MAQNSSFVLRSKTQLIESYLNSDNNFSPQNLQSMQQHEPQKRIDQDQGSLSPKIQSLFQVNQPRQMQVEFHRPKWQKHIHYQNLRNRASTPSTQLETNERHCNTHGNSSQKQRQTHQMMLESQYDSFGQERSFQIENESSLNMSQNSDRKLQYFQLDLKDLQLESTEENEQDTSRFHNEDDLRNQNEQRRIQNCQDFVKIIDEEVVNGERGNYPREYQQIQSGARAGDKHNKLMQMNSYIKQSQAKNRIHFHNFLKQLDY